MSINEIPVEVLGHILEQAQTEWSTSRYPIQEVVSHVSQRFRNVAMSTPSLWTDVRLHSKRSLHRAQKYLTRASNHSISLTLDLYRSDKNSDRHQLTMDDVAGIFSLSIQRTKRLVILTYNAYLCFGVLSILQNVSAPLLENISINSFPFQQDLFDLVNVGEFSTSIFDGGAPKLRSAHLANANVFVCRPPMASLISLTLDISDMVLRYRIGLQELTEIIASVPLLEDLTISSSEKAGLHDFTMNFPPPPSQIVTLNRLEKLRFINQPYVVHRLLKTVSTPKLQSLRIEGIFFDNSLEDIPRIPTLQLVSFCQTGGHLLRGTDPIFHSAKILEILFCNDRSLLSAFVHAENGAWPELDTLVWMTNGDHLVGKRMSFKLSGLATFLEHKKALGKRVRLLMEQEVCQEVDKKQCLPNGTIIEPLNINNYQSSWFANKYADPSGLRLT